MIFIFMKTMEKQMTNTTMTHTVLMGIVFKPKMCNLPALVIIASHNEQIPDIFSFHLVIVIH